MPATEFVGYDRSSEQGRVLALVADGELRDELAQGVEGILVLDQTPFYAEMGGQVGDHGTIQGPNGTFQVTDVQKNKGGKFMHSGKVVSGTLSVGETVTASIDVERRKAIMRAHSATHLLDAALKKVLGDHVHQAGSLVEPDRLRFDFTHFEGITPEQLAQIDKLVNDAILEGYPVATEVLPIEEAKKKGAVAMFGEKYGDIVRVVEMGDFSMEFCGGTHLDNTAKAGPFRIKSEGSVASGVRRIEATVGRLSLDTMNRNQELLFHAAQVLKTTPGELAAKAEQQAAEMKELRHELEKFKSEASLGEARQFLTAAKNVGGLKVLTAIRNGMDANALRQMGDFLRDKAPDVVAVLASANGEKITFLAVCGPEAVKRGIKAGDLVKSVCAICGGKGGGKPDSAMGGGSDLLKLDDALATVDDFVAEKLKKAVDDTFPGASPGKGLAGTEWSGRTLCQLERTSRRFSACLWTSPCWSWNRRQTPTRYGISVPRKMPRSLAGAVAGRTSSSCRGMRRCTAWSRSWQKRAPLCCRWGRTSGSSFPICSTANVPVLWRRSSCWTRPGSGSFWRTTMPTPGRAARRTSRAGTRPWPCWRRRSTSGPGTHSSG